MISDRLSLEDAITHAKEAIQRGYSHAGELWKEAALAAVHQIASESEYFVSDDVWDLGLPPAPTDSRALGGVLGKARSAGWIETTPEFRKGRGLARNATDVRIWRSLIVETTDPTQAEGYWD